MCEESQVPYIIFDLLANIAFCVLLSIARWKTHVYESVGRSLEVCCADVVVSQLQWCTFVLKQPTDIVIETITFTDSRGGIAENNCEGSMVR